MGTPESVIIADDHKIFSEGLRNILEAEPGLMVGACVYSSEELLSMLSATSADVLLVDERMTVVQSPEAVRHLRASYPLLKIVVLIMYDRPETIRSLVETGVNGILLKIAGREEIVSAIRSVCKGENYFPLIPEDFSWIKKRRDAGPLPADHTRVKPGILFRIIKFFNGIE